MSVKRVGIDEFILSVKTHLPGQPNHVQILEAGPKTGLQSMVGQAIPRKKFEQHIEDHDIRTINWNPTPGHSMF